MSRVSALATIAVAFLLTATLAAAQLGDAEITGLVKDSSNAPIPGTTLTLVNEDSGVTRTATSDDVGRYRLLALPPGRYVLDIEATDVTGNHTSLARGTSRIVFYVR